MQTHTQMCEVCRCVETANGRGVCTNCIGRCNRQGRVVYRCFFCLEGTYSTGRVCSRCAKRPNWRSRPIITKAGAQEARRRESITNNLCKDTRPTDRPACLVSRERAGGIDQFRAFRIHWTPLGRILTLLATCSTMQEAEAAAHQDIADLHAIRDSWPRIAARIEQLHRCQAGMVGITATENLELVNLTRLAKKCATLKETTP